MSVAACPSEGSELPASPLGTLASIRANGRILMQCVRTDAGTRIADLAESGGYRVKFPATEGDALGAVIVNTGGGVAGGDQVAIDITAEAGADVTVSTATAERVYRSLEKPTSIDVRLTGAHGAVLRWLPQPTILFSGARLVRRIEADVSANARLLIAEATVFGRAATGERMGPGLFRDDWRLRRDGRLLFAEGTRLDGEIGAILARPAVARSANATALLVYVAPDAEDVRDALRAALAGCAGLHGVSTWRGMLVLRALADGLEQIQSILQRAVEVLTRSPAPRVWYC